jgi:predicted ATPase
MAHRIRRIKIAGFRRLRELDLTVRPFAAVIGANGVAKTSLPDAFTLLSAAASGDLNRLMSQCGGIGNLLTRGKSEEMNVASDTGGTFTSSGKKRLLFLNRVEKERLRFVSYHFIEQPEMRCSVAEEDEIFRFFHNA